MNAQYPGTVGSQNVTSRYSSTADTAMPAASGLGNVQDEDVVYYNNGTWSVYFDGTAAGVGTDAALDLDAIQIP